MRTLRGRTAYGKRQRIKSDVTENCRAGEDGHLRAADNALRRDPA